MRTITLCGGPMDGQNHELHALFGTGIEPAEILMPLNPPEWEPNARYVRAEDGEYWFDPAAQSSHGHPTA